MESISTIALIGGSGRTGRFVIHKLLQQGHHIRLLLRAPENFNIQRPLIEIIKGEYMKGNFPLIQEDRQNAYSLLEVSKDIDWTLVRVPMIEFTAARANVTVSVEDCSGTKVTAGDIADFLVRQLDNSKYYRKAPFIANG